MSAHKKNLDVKDFTLFELQLLELELIRFYGQSSKWLSVNLLNSQEIRYSECFTLSLQFLFILFFLIDFEYVYDVD